jgi:transcriptional regulator with XRE-family HTH domain
MKSRRKPSSDVQRIPMGETKGALGYAIRTHRKKAGMTLIELAKKADFSISYLSQIERSLLTPSIATLRRIADALGIPAGQLMLKDGGYANSPVAVVRRNERKQLAFPGSKVHYELLTPDMRRRASLLWVEAPPGSESGPLFSHEGEDGVVVLTGTIEVEIGGVWHRLGAGDSIYFNAKISHRWRNGGSGPAQAIWLSTPPSF